MVSVSSLSCGVPVTVTSSLNVTVTGKGELLVGDDSDDVMVTVGDVLS